MTGGRTDRRKQLVHSHHVTTPGCSLTDGQFHDKNIHKGRVRRAVQCSSCCKKKKKKKSCVMIFKLQQRFLSLLLQRCLLKNKRFPQKYWNKHCCCHLVITEEKMKPIDFCAQWTVRQKRLILADGEQVFIFISGGAERLLVLKLQTEQTYCLILSVFLL